MERVAIEVMRRRTIRGGDRFEVFGDGGTGVVDTNAPLSDRALAYWDGLPGQAGHLRDGHLAGLHLDAVIPDGHLAGRHLTAEHMWPAALLVFETRRLYFGEFRFAVGTMDFAGNRSSGVSEVVVRVVNSSPRRASTLTKAGFDEVTRRLSFTFSPSPDL